MGLFVSWLSSYVRWVIHQTLVLINCIVIYHPHKNTLSPQAPILLEAPHVSNGSFRSVRTQDALIFTFARKFSVESIRCSTRQKNYVNTSTRGSNWLRKRLWIYCFASFIIRSPTSFDFLNLKYCLNRKNQMSFQWSGTELFASRIHPQNNHSAVKWEQWFPDSEHHSANFTSTSYKKSTKTTTKLLCLDQTFT